MPNLDEASAITGEKTPEKAAEKLLADGCRTAIIKLGEQGSYLRTVDTEIHSPAVRTVVYDAVGAGDVYNAGFIYGTLKDWPFESRMTFGSALAAQYISRRSDRFPSLENLKVDISGKVPSDTFGEV
jgi:5-dehydro-2-deoxygluconokinase